MKKRVRKILSITSLIIIALIILLRTAFTVDETQFAIVTQFGKPVRTITDAGL